MMTRHSTHVALAATICLAFSLQTTRGQVPVSDLVQDGEYGYSSQWQNGTHSASTGAAPTQIAPAGSGTAYGSSYGGAVPGGMERLPGVQATSGFHANELLSDVPCGYPPVVTEQSSSGSWANPGYGSASGNPLLGPGCASAPRLDVPDSRPGLYFAYDALYGSLSAPDLGSIGSAAAAGVYLTNGLPNPFYNTVSTDIIDSSPEFGHRIEFGCLNECGGFLVSFFSFNQDKGGEFNGGQIQFNDPFGMLRGYSDSNGDMVDDDINGNRIHGRNGEDLGVPNPLFNPPVNTERYRFGPDGVTLIYDGVPDTAAATDFGDLLTFVPIFDTLSVRSMTDIDGVELMYARPRRGCSPCRNGLMMLYGFRVLDVDEDFSLRGTGSFFDEANIRTQISNLIVGPSLGFNMCRRRGSWRFEGGLKSTLGLNFRRANQYGELGTNSSSQTATHGIPVNLTPSAFSNVQEDEEFAPVIEWRAGVSYCITDWMSARFGYTGMFIDGISRAANATDYTLPSFGLTQSNDHLNFNALTFGLEFYR